MAETLLRRIEAELESLHAELQTLRAELKRKPLLPAGPPFTGTFGMFPTWKITVMHILEVNKDCIGDNKDQWV
jgi:hypothetical protein